MLATRAFRGLDFFDEKFYIESIGTTLEPYRLWSFYLQAIGSLVEDAKWADLRDAFSLFERVRRAGRRGEMSEGSYVAFIEDLRLPVDVQDKRRLLDAMGPGLIEEVLRNWPNLRGEYRMDMRARQR